MVVARGWRRGNRKLSFNWFGVSVWEDEKLLEIDGGDGGMWMLNATELQLRNNLNGNFYVITTWGKNTLTRVRLWSKNAWLLNKIPTAMKEKLPRFLRKRCEPSQWMGMRTSEERVSQRCPDLQRNRAGEVSKLWSLCADGMTRNSEPNISIQAATEGPPLSESPPEDQV